MAFTKLKLTAFGSNIEAKAHQGKGLHFTRVAIGDGLLGNGSMINRTQLVSERHSMSIDGIVATENSSQSAVIVTLDNSQIEEGFSYREIALFAKDPDTGEEGAYLYDNAGQECEYLDTKDNGVIIYERLKLLIRVEQTDTVTFEASGNPLYLTAEDVEDMIRLKADLDEDGKVVQDQMPDMDYAPNTHAIQHAAEGSDPITPASIGAAPASHTHAAGDINSGTLSVARGGTAKASWTANRLIYPSAATTLTQLAFPSVAGSVLRQGTSGAPYWTNIDDLATAMGSAKIVFGTYTGSGTYDSDNPNSLTFSFAPKLILLFDDSLVGFMGNAGQYAERFFMLPDLLTTSFATTYAPYQYGGNTGGSNYAKKSSDGKTVSWYNTKNSGYQFNYSGSKYHYIAIG